MGILKRLHRVTVGRIEAFLDRVEDPEVVFPILIEEMEDQVRAATEAEARAMASVKMAERNVKNHQAQIERFTKGARMAVGQNNEETARLMLEAQIEAEKKLSVAQDHLETAKNSQGYATISRKRIYQQLEELRAKKDEILTRARIAKAQKRVQQTVTGSVGSSDSILDAVARLEANVEETEAELELLATLAGESILDPSLEIQLEELEQNSEIDKRLAELKQQM
ncbi:MAG: PspA/IM30 family protein [Phycisphaerae bacterium]|nr:PspA/IM30 family protein [Phycisphaerae bacterium]